VIWMI